MPVYSFSCEQCGPFETIRPIADYRKPGHCPECGRSCSKVVTAVHLNIMSTNNRKAHHLNEKSADEPRFVSKEESAARAHGHKKSSHKHQHGRGGHAHATASRPWQLGH